MRLGSYTPSEAAQILGIPHRRVLEQLAVGEIEAEVDTRTGRWKITKSSLNGSESTGLTEAEVAWQDEKALLLAELHRDRASADKEPERANREQEKAARERQRAEGLRRRPKELKAERSKGVRRRLLQRVKDPFLCQLGQEPKVKLALV